MQNKYSKNQIDVQNFKLLLSDKTKLYSKLKTKFHQFHDYMFVLFFPIYKPSDLPMITVFNRLLISQNHQNVNRNFMRKTKNSFLTLWIENLFRKRKHAP